MVLQNASREIFINQIAYKCNLQLKTLPQALDNTSRINVNSLLMYLPCPLVLKSGGKFVWCK